MTAWGTTASDSTVNMVEHSPDDEMHTAWAESLTDAELADQLAVPSWLSVGSAFRGL
jgi:hypothetical protein